MIDDRQNATKCQWLHFDDSHGLGKFPHNSLRTRLSFFPPFRPPSLTTRSQTTTPRSFSATARLLHSQIDDRASQTPPRHGQPYSRPPGPRACRFQAQKPFKTSN